MRVTPHGQNTRNTRCCVFPFSPDERIKMPLMRWTSPKALESPPITSESRRGPCISSSRVIFVSTTDRVSLGMLHACAPARLKYFRQYSTPIHGYIYARRIFTCSRRSYCTCPRRSPSKKVGPQLSRDIQRDILLLRELSDYEDEAECTYTIVRGMPARCKKPD